ncbi:MAG: hypothetical protein M1838_004763 [Thelocarpon superellum]|nr:MAG: hypothetical protein M1838_004763 [Thelocarpon superellum]
MANSRATSLAAIYDERSSSYDESWHPRLARDFVTWANMQPGDAVLDLACGTGLVTCYAKNRVGAEGRVVGIDVSEGMMARGRQRAASEGLDITFINHDVADLSDLDLLREGGFDWITCCSALVLLEDSQAALRQWSALLAPGGGIIFDVPVETAFVGGLILERIAQDSGITQGMLVDRLWIHSIESVRNLLLDAGLTADRVFESDTYDSRDIDASQASSVFDQCLKYTVYEAFRDPQVKEKARQLFIQEYEKALAPTGKGKEEPRLYVAIARKAA